MNAMHYCTKNRGGQLLQAQAARIASTAPELLDSPDDDGLTPLHLAVIQGNMELLRWLLAGKANVNALDNECHSVVHWATVCGEVEALRAVLAAGANIATADIHGGSPLHYAAQMCGVTSVMSCPKTYAAVAYDILTIILRHPETRVAAVDMDKRQPLLWASSAGSARAILALVNAGAKVESYDKDGLTAIHCAASRGHTECIDTLINLCGSPTDLTDKNGCTALHYAVALGHIDCVALLLDMQAQPDHQDLKGRTPAHCGCAKGQLETVKILGERGKANLWLQNAKGDLPVHDAAVSGRRELVAWLLKQRPDQVNVSSNDGRTLLHIAAENNYTDMCKMLLDAGADINSIYQTSENIVLTPLDCSLTRSFRATAKFLQMHGGLPASKLRIAGLSSSSAKTKTIAGHDMSEPASSLSSKPTKAKSKSKSVDSSDPAKECSTSTKKVVIYVDESLSESDDGGKSSRGGDLNKMISKLEHRRRKRKTHNMNRRFKTKSFNIYVRRNSSSDESKVNNCSEKNETSTKETSMCNTEEHVLIQATDINKDDSGAVDKQTDLPVDAKANKNDNAINHDKPATPVAKVDSVTGSKIKAHTKDDIVKESSASEQQDKTQKEATEIGKETTKETSDTLKTDDRETVEKDKTIAVDDSKQTANQDLKKTDVNSVELDNKPIEITDNTKGDAEADNNTVKDVLNDVPKIELAGGGDEVENKSNAADTHQDHPIVDEPAQKIIKHIADMVSSDAVKQIAIAEIHSTPADKQRQDDKVDDPSKPTDESKPEQTVESKQATKTETDNKTATELKENKTAEEKAQGPAKAPIVDAKEDQQHIAQPKADTTVRKTSFTVLDSLDDEIEPSFAVITSQPNDYSEAHDHTSSGEDDGDDDDDRPLNVRSFSAGQLPKLELPKRVQMRVSQPPVSGNKELDSGIEPSPRANMSSPQSTSSMDKSKRPMLPQKRWTSDGRSVHRKDCKQTSNKSLNMSTVALSLQEDINRYYMERQIFQHLLELKSLQIRSSRVLESTLVRRAVDDYHNSTLFPKNECVTDQPPGEVKRTLATKDSDPTYLRRYPYKEYTFKKFELHLYETLKSLQRGGSRNFQNISEVYREAERRNVLDKRSVASALRCTTKTHRCLHATHAYTGVPCAAYIPMMNHHTMPKPGFGTTVKTRSSGSFCLPEINDAAAAARHSKTGVSVEVSHGLSRKSLYLPTNQLDRNKRYYVTLSVKDTADRAA